MKEIPAGADLKTISSLLPGAFKSLEQAIEAISEVMQKGSFDTIHVSLNNGESALNLGYVSIDEGAELTDNDKMRITGLGEAGAVLLSRLPTPLALQLLASKLEERGDKAAASMLLMTATMLSVSGVSEEDGEEGEDEGCSDPTCDCHKHGDEPEATEPTADPGPEVEPSPWA
jgi:hypothetical protein